MDNKYDLFISYSRKDIAVADRICEALDDQGISYFIDRKGIGGGLEFPAVLAEAILSCRILLFLASENSYASKFTNKEINFAYNEKPKETILPYIIDGSRLPPSLRLAFSDINFRTLEEHPIETVLMQDLCQLLGYEYKNEEQLAQKRKKVEEAVKAQIEVEYQEALKRKEEQYKKVLQQEILLKEQQYKEQLQREREQMASQQDSQSPLDEEGQKQKKESSSKKKTKYDSLIGLAFGVPLLFLVVGVWYGTEYDSFWLGTEIFLSPSIAFFFFMFALHGWLNGERDYHLGVAFGLIPIIISVSIHTGIYLSSLWWGLGIAFFLILILIVFEFAKL